MRVSDAEHHTGEIFSPGLVLCKQRGSGIRLPLLAQCDNSDGLGGSSEDFIKATICWVLLKVL